jgi:hypothetical protein
VVLRRGLAEERTNIDQTVCQEQIMSRRCQTRL